jgi:hypothetical protein
VRPLPRLGAIDTARLIEDLVFEQISDLVPFTAIRELQQLIAVLLAEQSLPPPDALALAQGYIDRAMLRVARDQRIHHELERVMVIDECPV